MKYNIGETHHINGIECKVANISNGFVYFNDMQDNYVGMLFNKENVMVRNPKCAEGDLK